MRLKLSKTWDEQIEAQDDQKDELNKQILDTYNQLEKYQSWDGLKDYIRAEQQKAFVDIMNADGEHLILARERARVYSKMLQREIDCRQTWRDYIPRGMHWRSNMATDAFGLSDDATDFGEKLYAEDQPEEEVPAPEAEAQEEQPAEAAPEEPTEPQERPRDEQGRFIKLEEGEEPPAGAVVEEREIPEEEIGGDEVNIPAAEEEPRLWAGKYTAPEQLEQGYNESREQWRRAVEARKAEQQRAFEAEQREAEYARVIQESLPYLNRAAEREKQYHQFAEQYKAQLGQYPEGYTGPPTPREQQALAPDQVTAIVEERLQRERQQMQTEMAARQEYEATASAIMGFYRDHPEVEPRSPADNAITDTLTVLNEAWAMYDEEVDMTRSRNGRVAVRGFTTSSTAVRPCDEARLLRF